MLTFQGTLAGKLTRSPSCTDCGPSCTDCIRSPSCIGLRREKLGLSDARTFVVSSVTAPCKIIIEKLLKRHWSMLTHCAEVNWNVIKLIVGACWKSATKILLIFYCRRRRWIVVGLLLKIHCALRIHCNCPVEYLLNCSMHVLKIRCKNYVLIVVELALPQYVIVPFQWQLKRRWKAQCAFC